MKIKLSIIITIIIIILFILSCTNTKDTDSFSQIYESTDTLILYGYPYGDHLYSSAINIFKQKFPDVEIIYTQYDNSQQYNQIIQTEIPAGKGPDLLVFSSFDFPDIYKVMNTGVFCNLENFINNDSEFDMTLYNETVINSGIYNNTQYIMPLCYNINLLLTTQEALHDAGIDSTKINTFNGFTKEIQKYYAGGGRTNLLYDTLDGYGDTLTFFPWCGVEVIDYENKTINIDNDAFKLIMDTYKAIYQNDKTNSTRPPKNYVYTSGLQERAVLNRQILFSMDSSNYFSSLLVGYGGLLYAETPILLPYPNISNKTTASVQLMASILSTAKNKKNAFEFLKILLSDDIQSKVDTFTIQGIPVLMNAIDERLTKTINNTGYGIVTAPVTLYDGNSWMISAIPEQTLEDMKNKLISVDNCQLCVYGLFYNFVTPLMTPYFDGVDSYENCLKKLRNDLELYLAE